MDTIKKSAIEFMQGIILGITLTVILWINISTIVQAIKCPELTQTELIIKIPQSFKANWVECN